MNYLATMGGWGGGWGALHFRKLVEVGRGGFEEAKAVPRFLGAGLGGPPPRIKIENISFGIIRGNHQKETELAFRYFGTKLEG